MTTRVLYLEQGDCRQASRLIDDPKLSPPLRLWVEAELGGLIRVGLIAVSSRTETAVELRYSQSHSFWATKDDIRWFIEQLPAALAFAEEKEPLGQDPDELRGEQLP
jgi:hypothetical protein